MVCKSRVPQFGDLLAGSFTVRGFTAHTLSSHYDFHYGEAFVVKAEMRLNPYKRVVGPQGFEP